MAYSHKRNGRNGHHRNGAAAPLNGNGNGNSRRTRVPPHLLRAVKARDERRRGVNRTLLTLLGIIVIIALLIPTSALAAGGLYYVQTASRLEPRLETLETYRPFQTSRIYDRNGTLLHEYVTEGRRDPVSLSEVSQDLIDATVAVEDKNFWTNPGVDYVGIARSAYMNFQAEETVSGASTITQQFVKLVVLNEEERREGLSRKIKEAILAQQLTQERSKQQILEMYLNEVNYGNRAYGIQAAAREYFGVDAKDLTLNQASLLAGLPQLPTLYNPIEHINEDRVLPGIQLKPGWLNPSRPLPNGTTRPRGRQVDVLRQMVLNGMISEREAREAIAEDLQIVDPQIERVRDKQQAPHFVDYVVEQLENDPEIGPLLLNEGGLNITTTLDLRFQEIAQREAREGIEQLLSEGRNIHNSAVVIQQPNTGQILAMVGSIDYTLVKPTTAPDQDGNLVDGQVNVATRERQPGSALKPFTYLSVLREGQATPATVFWDVDTRFVVNQGANDSNIDSCIPEGQYYYCPKNYDRRWHGPVRIRESLANSLNMPAILAIKEAGVRETIELLHEAGITGLQRDDYGYGLTLGGGEVQLLDLTTAYNTLANEGRYIQATGILQITNRNGEVLRDANPQPRRIVDERLVALIRDYMSDNVARTPMFGADSALNVSRPAAAKTGTTNDYRDAWAMGFTPYVTVGVWAGNNNNESTGGVGGIGAGGLIWGNVMENIFANRELDNFLRDNGRISTEFPPLESYGLVQSRICQIGTVYGPRTTEWFTPEMLAEQGANEGCDLYRRVQAVRTADGSLCLPQPGVNYGGAVTTLTVWNVPQSAPDMKIIGSVTGGEEGTAAAPQNYCPANVQIARPSPTPTPSQPSAQPTTEAPAQPTPQPAQQPAPQPPAQPAPQPTPVPAPPAPPPSEPVPPPSEPAPPPSPAP